MKTLLVLFGLSFSLVALFACAEQNEVEPPPTEEPVMGEGDFMDRPSLAENGGVADAMGHTHAADAAGDMVDDAAGDMAEDAVDSGSPSAFPAGGPSPQPQPDQLPQQPLATAEPANALSESNRMEAVAQLERRLAPGGVAFTTPEELDLGASTIVELIVASARNFESLEELEERLESSGIVQSDSAKVAAVMRADLEPSVGLRVEPLVDQTRVVTANRDATWRWRVSGIEEGDQTLHSLFVCSDSSWRGGVSD